MSIKNCVTISSREQAGCPNDHLQMTNDPRQGWRVRASGWSVYDHASFGQVYDCTKQLGPRGVEKKFRQSWMAHEVMLRTTLHYEQ